MMDLPSDVHAQELSRYTPGMVSAIGTVLSSEYTLCEPDDEAAILF